MDAAVIMTQPQARGASGGKGSPVLRDSLADGLQRLKPAGLLDGMDAHALGRVVVDGCKNGNRALRRRGMKGS